MLFAMNLVSSSCILMQLRKASIHVRTHFSDVSSNGCPGKWKSCGVGHTYFNKSCDWEQSNVLYTNVTQDEKTILATLIPHKY